MNRSPLCARSWLSLSLVLAAAPLPMACQADGTEPLDGQTDTDGTDTEGTGGIDGNGDTEGAAAGWLPLVSHDAWQPDAAEDDPLPAHRPAQVECDGGWYLESGGIEIDTAECNYLSLQQPLLAPIEAGDSLHLQLWWQTLASVDPAEGHIAIFVDGALLWEELVPIPGDADARSLEFPSPLGAPAGATLTLHLHNHGYNTWHFHELSVLGSET